MKNIWKFWNTSTGTLCFVVYVYLLLFIHLAFVPYVDANVMFMQCLVMFMQMLHTLVDRWKHIYMCPLVYVPHGMFLVIN